LAGVPTVISHRVARWNGVSGQNSRRRRGGSRRALAAAQQGL